MISGGDSKSPQISSDTSLLSPKEWEIVRLNQKADALKREIEATLPRDSYVDIDPLLLGVSLGFIGLSGYLMTRFDNLSTRDRIAGVFFSTSLAGLGWAGVAGMNNRSNNKSSVAFMGGLSAVSFGVATLIASGPSNSTAAKIFQYGSGGAFVGVGAFTLINLLQSNSDCTHSPDINVAVDRNSAVATYTKQF